MAGRTVVICDRFAACCAAFVAYYKLLKNNMKLAGIGVDFRWPSEGESARKFGS
jgi:hypothetical protein